MPARTSHSAPPGRRVVFATYQSSPQIAAAYERRVPGFDLAVAD
jgi:predicted helicase